MTEDELIDRQLEAYHEHQRAVADKVNQEIQQAEQDMRAERNYLVLTITPAMLASSELLVLRQLRDVLGAKIDQANPIGRHAVYWGMYNAVYAEITRRTGEPNRG